MKQAGGGKKRGPSPKWVMETAVPPAEGAKG